MAPLFPCSPRVGCGPQLTVPGASGLAVPNHAAICLGQNHQCFGCVGGGRTLLLGHPLPPVGVWARPHWGQGHMHAQERLRTEHDGTEAISVPDRQATSRQAGDLVERPLFRVRNVLPDGGCPLWRCPSTVGWGSGPGEGKMARVLASGRGPEPVQAAGSRETPERRFPWGAGRTQGARGSLHLPCQDP